MIVCGIDYVNKEIEKREMFFESQSAMAAEIIISESTQCQSWDLSYKKIVQNCTKIMITYLNCLKQKTIVTSMYNCKYLGLQRCLQKAPLSLFSTLQRVMQKGDDGLIYRQLEPKYIDQSIEVLTLSFVQGQPLTRSYFKQFPTAQQNKYNNFRDLWRMFAEDASQNRVSCVAVNPASDQVVGVVYSKNANYVPPGFEQKYLSNVNWLSGIARIQDYLISQASQEHKQILANNKVVDMWAAGVLVEYQRRGILHRMNKFVLQRAKEQGYTHNFSMTTSFKSRQDLKGKGFFPIANTSAREFQEQDERGKVRPYALVEEENNAPTILLRMIP